ncbi:hypothetical protein GCM10009844_22660 [Nocardioides koreensis]|uniref:PIN domain-containing protein n=1 Tax=Nocardioides koreensis TaxID=433651 RepID=A0ABN2ZRS2_9ACTN
MSSIWYLVDNNVLSRLSREQRGSRFFRASCRLPSEVLYEASELPDIADLRRLEYPVCDGVLERVREVMSTVAPGDFKLIDLYRNLGNADPILVATALHAIDVAASSLFEEDWRIVSEDRAVRAKASEFGLRTLGFTEFLSMLPGTGSS